MLSGGVRAHTRFLSLGMTKAHVSDRNVAKRYISTSWNLRASGRTHSRKLKPAVEDVIRSRGGSFFMLRPRLRTPAIRLAKHGRKFEKLPRTPAKPEAGQVAPLHELHSLDGRNYFENNIKGMSEDLTNSALAPLQFDRSRSGRRLRR